MKSAPFSITFLYRRISLYSDLKLGMRPFRIFFRPLEIIVIRVCYLGVQGMLLCERQASASIPTISPQGLALIVVGVPWIVQDALRPDASLT